MWKCLAQTDYTRSLKPSGPTTEVSSWWGGNLKGSNHQLPWSNAMRPVIHRRGRLRLHKVGCWRQDPSACQGGHMLASVCTLCPSLIHGWEPTGFNFFGAWLAGTIAQNLGVSSTFLIYEWFAFVAFVLHFIAQSCLKSRWFPAKIQTAR